MDRILKILKKENGPRASSAPALELNTIIFKHVYWYMQQISGERLQDHWSSGYVCRNIYRDQSMSEVRIYHRSTSFILEMLSYPVTAFKLPTLERVLYKLYFIMSPPDRVGRHIVFPRASVCLSCPLYNLKTVKDFSMKLGTLVNHDETMCHAQEP